MSDWGLDSEMVDCMSCGTVSSLDEVSDRGGRCPVCGQYNHDLDAGRHHAAARKLHTAADSTLPPAFGEDTNVVHRMVGWDLPYVMRQRGHTPESIAQDLKRDPEGTAHSIFGSIEDNYGGIGHHFTRNPAMADYIADVKGDNHDFHVVFSGTHDPEDVNTNNDDLTGGEWPEEEETTLLPGSSVNIHQMKIRPSHSPDWTTVPMNRDSYASWDRNHTASRRLHTAADEDYRDSHQAPGPEDGAPMHDVTQGIYPASFYDEPFRYWGTDESTGDRDSWGTIHKVRGNPDARVKVHRALPLDVAKRERGIGLAAPLNTGDWVTPSYNYAHEHGMSRLEGNTPWTVVTSTVPASQLHTDGNSLAEWGYNGPPTQGYEGANAAGKRKYRQQQVRKQQINAETTKDFHHCGFCGSPSGEPCERGCWGKKKYPGERDVRGDLPGQPGVSGGGEIDYDPGALRDIRLSHRSADGIRYAQVVEADVADDLARMRLAAVNQDLVDKLHNEFHQWAVDYAGPSEDLYGDQHNRGPIGEWKNVESFLHDRYPAAHKNHDYGQEEAAWALDGHEPMPYQLENQGKEYGSDLTPYATGPEAVAQHGYDPAEIAASMVLLHNQSHPLRGNLAQEDQDRLTDIFQKRQKMQRDYDQRTKTAMPWYHRTDDELNPGDHLLPYNQVHPDHQEVGDESWNPNKAYVYYGEEDDSSDHAPYAGYGQHIYEIEPHDDPQRDYGDGNHSSHMTDGGTVIKRLPDEDPYSFGEEPQWADPIAHKYASRTAMPWSQYEQARNARLAMPAMTRLHRGIGFGKGDLPADLERRVDSVLSGGHDPALSEILQRHLDRDGLGKGQYWALDPVAADLFGRQVRFRDQSDVQVMLSGDWDETGHVQGDDVDPRYRKLRPGSSPVNVNSVKVRRTPSGSWMNPSDEGWVDLHHASHTAARLAMPAPLPQGTYFRYHPELVWSPGVTAHAPGGKQVGSLEWYDDDHVMVDLGTRRPGEIDRIQVPEDHRGQSIATSMFDFAKQHEPRLHHSDILTEDGRGWSAYEQSRHDHARLASSEWPDPSRETIPADPQYVYHGTHDYNAQDIADFGHLDVHDPDYGTDQDTWPDGSVEPRSYWTHDPQVARNFYPEGGRPTLLRSPRSSGDFRQERHSGDLYSTSPISADHLEVYSGPGQWTPLTQHREQRTAGKNGPHAQRSPETMTERQKVRYYDTLQSIPELNTPRENHHLAQMGDWAQGYFGNMQNDAQDEIQRHNEYMATGTHPDGSPTLLDYENAHHPSLTGSWASEVMRDHGASSKLGQLASDYHNALSRVAEHGPFHVDPNLHRAVSAHEALTDARNKLRVELQHKGHFSVPAVDDLSHLDDPNEADVVGCVNPRHHVGTGGRNDAARNAYKINCQRCTLAAELRHRGLNVEAQRNFRYLNSFGEIDQQISDKQFNDHDIASWFRNADGSIPRWNDVEDEEDPEWEPEDLSDLTDKQREQYMRGGGDQPTRLSSRTGPHHWDHMTNQIAKWGPGARGMVTISQPALSGGITRHVFNAIVGKDGKVHYVDHQTGEHDVSHFRNSIAYEHQPHTQRRREDLEWDDLGSPHIATNGINTYYSSLRYLRTDDKGLATEVSQHVVDRGTADPKPIRAPE